ncbi:hypothetical protein AB1Y20_013126 [Prymnesium parvum]|uniref:Uncharacterized protein n=1 Tax=Prymnesium parvum TaxID=97485 RepID=A0AB34IJR2_PRYPA
MSAVGWQLQTSLARGAAANTEVSICREEQSILHEARRAVHHDAVQHDTPAAAGCSAAAAPDAAEAVDETSPIGARDTGAGVGGKVASSPPADEAQASASAAMVDSLPASVVPPADATSPAGICGGDARSFSEEGGAPAREGSARTEEADPLPSRDFLAIPGEIESNLSSIGEELAYRLRPHMAGLSDAVDSMLLLRDGGRVSQQECTPPPAIEGNSAAARSSSPPSVTRSMDDMQLTLIRYLSTRGSSLTRAYMSCAAPHDDGIDGAIPDASDAQATQSPPSPSRPPAASPPTQPPLDPSSSAAASVPTASPRPPLAPDVDVATSGPWNDALRASLHEMDEALSLVEVVKRGVEAVKRAAPAPTTPPPQDDSGLLPAEEWLIANRAALSRLSLALDAAPSDNHPSAGPSAAAPAEELNVDDLTNVPEELQAIRRGIASIFRVRQMDGLPEACTATLGAQWASTSEAAWMGGAAGPSRFTDIPPSGQFVPAAVAAALRALEASGHSTHFAPPLVTDRYDHADGMRSAYDRYDHEEGMRSANDRYDHADGIRSADDRYDHTDGMRYADDRYDYAGGVCSDIDTVAQVSADLDDALAAVSHLSTRLSRSPAAPEWQVLRSTRDASCGPATSSPNQISSPVYHASAASPAHEPPPPPADPLELGEPPKGWSELQWVQLDEARSRLRLDIDAIFYEVHRLATSEGQAPPASPSAAPPTNPAPACAGGAEGYAALSGGSAPAAASSQSFIPNPQSLASGRAFCELIQGTTAAQKGNSGWKENLHSDTDRPTGFGWRDWNEPHRRQLLSSAPLFAPRLAATASCAPCRTRLAAVDTVNGTATSPMDSECHDINFQTAGSGFKSRIARHANRTPMPVHRL